MTIAPTSSSIPSGMPSWHIVVGSAMHPESGELLDDALAGIHIVPGDAVADLVVRLSGRLGDIENERDEWNENIACADEDDEEWYGREEDETVLWWGHWMIRSDATVEELRAAIVEDPEGLLDKAFIDGSDDAEACLEHLTDMCS